MPDAPPALGRRDAQKARTHRAIIDAAVALTSRTGLSGLSVDTVAELADVSRRTVFNHFDTLDEIVLAACTEVLDVVVDGFTAATVAVPPGGQTRAALFSDVARAVRETDLVGPMAYLTRALDPGVEQGDPRVAALVDAALRRTGEHLLTEMSLRYPKVPELDVALLASSLLSGIGVLHHEWRERTGAADDAASRRVWESLLDHLLDTLRAGHAAP
ncbi:TetR/AcrR family transcriptional regulator [Pseudonocardia pini]|uniref:TetR/AcrR family transcriptional regulator n=1 Tax=Pseudonocardia pini TaxID=2758030 RepID=UPI0015F0E0D1|nr:TetR/AcrR family transcriptional regulator [Pseudonocardia pini]